VAQATFEPFRAVQDSVFENVRCEELRNPNRIKTKVGSHQHRPSAQTGRGSLRLLLTVSSCLGHMACLVKVGSGDVRSVEKSFCFCSSPLPCLYPLPATATSLAEMSELRPELAQTVVLLQGYRITLETMLKPDAELQSLLDFGAGLDLLHIIIQLVIVDQGAADRIYQECRGFAPTPQNYRLGFVSLLSGCFYNVRLTVSMFKQLDIFEGLGATKTAVLEFIRAPAAFTAIVDRLKRIHDPRRPAATRSSPWWINNVASTVSVVWAQATNNRTSACDQKRFDLLYAISQAAGLFGSDPPPKVRNAYSNLQGTLVS